MILTRNELLKQMLDELEINNLSEDMAYKEEHSSALEEDSQSQNFEEEPEMSM